MRALRRCAQRRPCLSDSVSCGKESPASSPLTAVRWNRQEYERVRAQQREAERQAEHLFQALLEGAFREEVQENYYSGFIKTIHRLRNKGEICIFSVVPNT